MSAPLHPGDRILARDRLWRVRTSVAANDTNVIVDADALDGDSPSTCAFLIPPETVEVLPAQHLSLEQHLVESFEAWATAHLLIGATLVQETGLLAGARFGRVQLEAYQLAPTLRVLAKPRPSILIADDVGLGKTIEAGLILLELMARKRASRVLIVAPPGLLDQWQQEMADKFSLQFTMIEDAAGFSRVQSELPAGINPWDALPRVLTSLDFLKRASVKARALRKRWDLVIVDEAHALAESGSPRAPFRTQRTRLGTALRAGSRGLVLLTATPHNGYTHSYRSLLELVEPTMATFAGTPADVERRVDASRVRRLKRHIARRLSDGRVVPAFPQRHVTGFPVSDLADIEKELLSRVSSYCSRTAREAEGSEDEELIGFAMQIVKKRALSSKAALLKTIGHRLEALQDEESRDAPPEPAEMRDLRLNLPLGDDQADATARRILRAAIPAEERRRRAEVKALTGIKKLLRKAPATDPKAEALVGALREAISADETAKVIVFTEYRDTLDMLVERLEKEGHLVGGSVILRGGLTRSQRLQRQTAFEQPAVHVLLATDAASEGLNLQKHCSRIIHMELPWNPNRLEQRNGRVDRYGQTREPDIRYLFYPDSAEERVLHRLVEKMETMARDRIATPDILGLAVGGNLEDGLVRLDPDDEAAAERADALVADFDRQEADFSKGLQPLLGLGDAGAPEEMERIGELLDTQRPLLPDDQSLEAAVRRVLGSTAMTPVPDRSGVYRIEVPWQYRGPGVQQKYTCATFNRTVAIGSDVEEVEFLTPMHPLVKSLALEARQKLLQAYGGSRGVPARRLAVRRVPGTEQPSAVFTFLASIGGGGGLLEESLLAVRIDTEGKALGDPVDNLVLIARDGAAGDEPWESVHQLFSGCFEAMRLRADSIASEWLHGRIEKVRARREEQAELLLRDLAVDMTDRLREIDVEEQRARTQVDEVGQQQLFPASDLRVDGFDARRSAVGAYAATRREEIAEYRVIASTGSPRPMGVLFLVPGGAAS